MQKRELECVYVAQGLTQGEAIKAKLESYDIPALLQYEAAFQSAFSVSVGPMGEVRVMVPADVADYAREVLLEEPRSDEEPTE